MEKELGFKAIKHQKFVGTGYFDLVQNTVQGGNASTVALKGSTEEAQFHAQDVPAHA
jgi:isocitrate lyase